MSVVENIRFGNNWVAGQQESQEQLINQIYYDISGAENVQFENNWVASRDELTVFF